MINEIKQKVENIVSDYKKLFYSEYLAVCDIVIQKRKNTINDFGETLDPGSALGRQILEMPDTLHAIFNTRLTGEELKEFREKENQRWFAKRFGEFCVVNKL